MTVVGLALGYVGVGAFLALMALVARRAAPVDALLLLGLWPLYGPVLVGGGRVDAAPSERALLAALRGAGDVPVAGALLDADGARELARRLRVGRARLRDLEQVLARPALDLAIAQARVEALARGGARDGAVAAARRRVEAIGQLRALRDRCAADLEQVDEVIAQLTTQLEVARFAGAADATIAELASDLCARVDGLEARLGNGLADPRVASP
ncbi:MAG: hypothetical protein JNK64_14100 [Myxococcales bacterium]|nr:hypothetical protein [Myxococcales bacterium]